MAFSAPPKVLLTLFSRNVSTGDRELYGEFLPQAQGEDVVSGSRTPMPISRMRRWNKQVYDQLNDLVMDLEMRHNDVVDVEFTVENGELYLLQVRSAKRTSEAGAVIAVNFVEEGRWSQEYAVKQVVATGHHRAKIIQIFDPKALKQANKKQVFCKGLSASKGVVSGIAVFSEHAARQYSKHTPTILFRKDTSPDDLPTMIAASAVVTATGGFTSHAAVVARGLNKPAVVGCKGLQVDEAHEYAQMGSQVVHQGRWVALDGNTGIVYVGQVNILTPPRRREIDLLMQWLVSYGYAVGSPPRIAWEKIDDSSAYRSIHLLINDFYLTDMMAQVSDAAMPDSPVAIELRQLQQRVHQETADIIATYLMVAIAGELRHVDRIIQDGSVFLKGQIAQLEKYNIQQGGDRSLVQQQAAQKLKDLATTDLEPFLQIAVDTFDNQGNGWPGGSFGGKPWANIARVLMSFLRGEIGHTVFVDQAFDLQHNHGSVFGKHPIIGGNRDYVSVQLDEKKRAITVEGLYEALNQYLYGTQRFSPAVEAAYESGQKSGLWQMLNHAAHEAA